MTHAKSTNAVVTRRLKSVRMTFPLQTLLGGQGRSGRTEPVLGPGLQERRGRTETATDQKWCCVARLRRPTSGTGALLQGRLRSPISRWYSRGGIFIFYNFAAAH